MLNTGELQSTTDNQARLVELEQKKKRLLVLTEQLQQPLAYTPKLVI